MPFSFLYLPRDACGHSGAPASVLCRFSTPTPYYHKHTHTLRRMYHKGPPAVAVTDMGNALILLSSESGVHIVPLSNTDAPTWIGCLPSHFFPCQFMFLIMIKQTSALKSPNNLTTQLLINKRSSKLSKGSHPFLFL